MREETGDVRILSVDMYLVYLYFDREYALFTLYGTILREQAFVKFE